MSSTETSPPSRVLHIGTWVVQVLLLVAFTGAGLGKLTPPRDVLLAQNPWFASLPEFLPYFVGTCELLGALGMVLPSATRIKPQLTALAGAGLATVMLLAAILHATRGETQIIGANAVLGGLAAFVAWSRSKGAPIPARS